MILIWPMGNGSGTSELNACVLPVLSLLGGAAGGIFGSYFAKRGEIAAISKKLDEVVKQNHRIVEESEEIRIGLSERSWAKQRKWEWQRDIAMSL